MKRILIFAALFFQSPALFAAAPDDFLGAYRQFFASANFMARAQGVKAVDDFFKANFTPLAKLRVTHQTAWELSGMAPKQVEGHGQASPANWKGSIGPLYEGQPILFPQEIQVEEATITPVSQTATSLDTNEQITVKYRLIPQAGWFRATLASKCHYSFTGAKVSDSHCKAQIRVTSLAQ